MTTLRLALANFKFSLNAIDKRLAGIDGGATEEAGPWQTRH
jgi:hypothetical protein